jgi:hypothetical protein
VRIKADAAYEGINDEESEAAMTGISAASEGISEGIMEGISEGIMEDISEGIMEGIMEGISEGIMED